MKLLFRIILFNKTFKIISNINIIFFIFALSKYWEKRKGTNNFQIIVVNAF